MNASTRSAAASAGESGGATTARPAPAKKARVNGDEASVAADAVRTKVARSSGDQPLFSEVRFRRLVGRRGAAGGACTAAA
jgi:hypothetical protein